MGVSEGSSPASKRMRLNGKQSPSECPTFSLASAFSAQTTSKVVPSFVQRDAPLSQVDELNKRSAVRGASRVQPGTALPPVPGKSDARKSFAPGDPPVTKVSTPSSRSVSQTQK